MENRIFFPQEALDTWIVEGTIDLQESALTILAEGRVYRLTDGVRVMREVGGAGDPHDLVGRVKTRAQLEELGAEIVETSMLMGDLAYDVEPGWLGVPAGPFAEHAASDARTKARAGRSGDAPRTDEELLARFVGGTL